MLTGTGPKLSRNRPIRGPDLPDHAGRSDLSGGFGPDATSGKSTARSVVASTWGGSMGAGNSGMAS